MSAKEYKIMDEETQAKVGEEVIRRLKEEAKTPMTAAEIREQVASYIASEMDGYPREKIDEYMNRTYGELPS